MTMMPLPGKNGDLFRKRKEMFSPLLNHLCQAMRRTKEIMPLVADEVEIVIYFLTVCVEQRRPFLGCNELSSCMHVKI